MWKSVFAITLGAALGALLRWLFGLKLNALFPTIAPGTQAANLIGGYVIGLGLAFFAALAGLASVAAHVLGSVLMLARRHVADWFETNAEDHGIDHIVVGHRGHGLFERWLIGSVARQVIAYAPCAVTVVRPRA